MKQATVFLGWVAAGSGIVLLYSAYRNQGPLSVLTTTLQGGGTKTTINTGHATGSIAPGVTGTSTGSPVASSLSAGGSSRAAGIQARTIAPVYVSIGSQPNLVLDKDAAASFAQVEATFGRKILLSGASRSYAEQAASYALHPDRFAPPGHSLHEVGLAVDVAQTYNLEDPNLLNAFTVNNWIRGGKMGNWYGKGQIHEPWHWSYGVSG